VFKSANAVADADRNGTDWAEIIARERRVSINRRSIIRAIKRGRICRFIFNRREAGDLAHPAGIYHRISIHGEAGGSASHPGITHASGLEVRAAPAVGV